MKSLLISVSLLVGQVTESGPSVGSQVETSLAAHWHLPFGARAGIFSEQHLAPVEDLLFLSDSRLISVGADGRLIEWSADGTCLRCLSIDGRQCRALAAHSDRLLAVSSIDPRDANSHLILLLDRSGDYKLVRVLNAYEPVRAVHVIKVGDQDALYCVADSGNCTIWSLADGTVLGEFVPPQGWAIGTERYPAVPVWMLALGQIPALFYTDSSNFRSTVPRGSEEFEPGRIAILASSMDHRNGIFYALDANGDLSAYPVRTDSSSVWLAKMDLEGLSSKGVRLIHTDQSVLLIGERVHTVSIEGLSESIYGGSRHFTREGPFSESRELRIEKNGPYSAAGWDEANQRLALAVQGTGEILICDMKGKTQRIYGRDFAIRSPDVVGMKEKLAYTLGDHVRTVHLTGPQTLFTDSRRSHDHERQPSLPLRLEKGALLEEFPHRPKVGVREFENAVQAFYPLGPSRAVVCSSRGVAIIDRDPENGFSGSPIWLPLAAKALTRVYAGENSYRWFATEDASGEVIVWPSVLPRYTEDPWPLLGWHRDHNGWVIWNAAGEFTASSDRALAHFGAWMPVPTTASENARLSVVEFRPWNHVSLERRSDAIGSLCELLTQPQFTGQRYTDAVVAGDREEATRLQARYVSFAHLLAMGIYSRPGLRATALDLTAAVNILSWSPEFVAPVPVDPLSLIWRIDTRQLKASSPGRQDWWVPIAKRYPFAAERSQQVTWVRGDWLLIEALQAPLYYDILALPRTAEQLEQQLIQRGREVPTISATFHSRVSQRPRFFERFPLTEGTARSDGEPKKNTESQRAYWRSYDLDSTDRLDEWIGRDLTERRPVTLQHDGGEILFHLRNGLIAAMVVDRNGNRWNFSPIATGTSHLHAELAALHGRGGSFTASVPHGIRNCLACHFSDTQTGIRPIANRLTSPPRVTFGEISNGLVTQNEELIRLTAKDSSLFQSAIKVCAGDSYSFDSSIAGEGSDPFFRLESACAALDESPEQFNARLERFAAGRAAELSVLRLGDQIPKTRFYTIMRRESGGAAASRD